MRALVQRVARAEVRSRVEEEWQVAGAIGAGLCVLAGVTHEDDEQKAAKLADKLWGLRIFDA
jgi:D-tyrosyl-tRNA(Tyr) deacylase